MPLTTDINRMPVRDKVHTPTDRPPFGPQAEKPALQPDEVQHDLWMGARMIRIQAPQIF